MLWSLVFLLSGHEARAQSPADQCRPAVVHLDGGSGVCISPDGWILTAAHMLPGWPFDPPNLRPRNNPWLPGQTPPLRRPPASVTVTWESGQRLQAKVCVIQDTDERSDIAVLKAEGSNLPFRPIATRAPAVGDAVYAAGYPAGNWAWNEGRIIGIGPMQVPTAHNGRVETQILDMTQTNYRANPGASGGPLFNLDRQVIGVCSRGTPSGNQKTLFARWENLTACILKAGYRPTAAESGLPVLQVWSGPDCIHCRRFDSDLERGIFCGGSRLQEVFRIDRYDITHQPELAAKLGVVQVPTFIPPDGKPIVGYKDGPTLANMLVQFQFPIVAGVPPPTPDPAFPGPPPAPGPPQALAPPPEKAAEKTEEAPPDMTAVRVIGLVQKQGAQDWGVKAWLKGVALTKVERRLEVILPAKVREKLGDKVRATVVFQRLNPSRYDELVTAAAVPQAKAAVVILVGKQFEGLTGKLIAFVETKLADLAASHNETIDITIIFERSDTEQYHDVITALAEEEPAISDETATVVGGGGIVGIITGVIAWFTRRRTPPQEVLPTAD